MNPNSPTPSSTLDRFDKRSSHRFGKWLGRAGWSSGHGMPCPYCESEICGQALGVGAGEAGAWAGGHAAGAALGAFVGLVAGDI